MLKDFFRTEVKSIVLDWYRYMDTGYPKHVDRKLFNHLKYTVRAKIVNFNEKYPEIDIRLLEKVALYEFMKQSDEEILKKIGRYSG